MKHIEKIFNVSKFKFSCLALCFFTGSAGAALPPDYQNEKDLLAIVSYIKSDHEVLSSLRLIDLPELTVYYGDSCRVQFARKLVKRDAGWVGPAEPIEFKAKECADDVANADEQVAPGNKVRHGVILSAEVADTACYLQIKDEKGMAHEELASFSLCEDETLLNKPSDFIYERTHVMAVSCEGDLECTDSEQIWLITQVK